jgi:hypothetical protein
MAEVPSSVLEWGAAGRMKLGTAIHCCDYGFLGGLRASIREGGAGIKSRRRHTGLIGAQFFGFTLKRTRPSHG